MNDTSSNRILHVPRRFVADEWGGTETVILEIARHQQRLGARPEIMTSMALSKCRAESIAGVPVTRFGYTYPFLGLSRADCAMMDKKGGNLLSLSLFRSLLCRSEVRLYHAHALKRLGGEVRTAARLRKKPFVVSIHGGVFDVPTAERDQMLKPIANKPEWGKVFGALFGSRRILNDADQVICVGESEMILAKKHLDHDRITYLPNGVDHAKFARGNRGAFREKHGIPAKAFLALNISRIDPQKNQILLLEAFLRFSKKQPESFLVMIGPETQPDYAVRIREFIATHNLQSKVRLLPGMLNDSFDLVNAYAASDVFVLPSRHEPFGIVVLEAWSARCPVIVNHVGGLKTLVTHERTGLFINPEREGTADELAAQMQLLASNAPLRDQLGCAGSVESLRNYDWNQIASRLEQLYQAAEQHAAHRYGKTMK